MTQQTLATVVFTAGVAQLGVLLASALVPFRLDWRHALSPLPWLHQQMYWVYGGYVVMSIVAFALLSIFNAQELARGAGLSRGLCFYIAVFWGIRLVFQGVFDVRAHLTVWWLRIGYHTLTVLFAMLAAVYGWIALGSR